MGDLLGNLTLGDVGPVGLLTIGVLLILVGRLVPKSALDYERENARAWQAAAETQREVNVELKGAVLEIVPLARSTDHAIRSIQIHGLRAQQDTPTSGPEGL